MDNLLNVPTSLWHRDLPANCSINRHFSRSLYSTISFPNNHWILMSTSAVLSLASELEWQCAGNQSLNPRACCVMEMSSGYPPAYNAWISVSFTGSQHFDVTGACKRVSCKWHWHADLNHLCVHICQLSHRLMVWKWWFLSHGHYVFVFFALSERKCAFPSAGMRCSLQTGFRNFPRNSDVLLCVLRPQQCRLLLNDSPAADFHQWHREIIWRWLYQQSRDTEK